LLNSGDADVNGALAFFNVDRTLLAQQWASLTPAPPLAWNDALATAAFNHSQLMLAAQQQSHQLPGEPSLGARLTNAGYTSWSSAGENIFAYAQSPFEAHAAFAIDWGGGPGGIQSPPGHRQNIMSTGFREVGIGMVDAPGPAAVGPLLVTQDFGNRFGFGNPFLLGAVYNDANNNGFYNQGEGLGSVNLAITGTGGTFNVASTPAGGYQLQVPAGTYQVTASGGGLSSPVVQNVTIGTQNVRLNFIRPIFAAPLLTGPATPITDNTPTFTWNPVLDAVRYDLWVNNVTTGANQVIRETNLSTPSFTPTTALPSGSYRFWVQAWNGAGDSSAWSAARDFVIQPPAVPGATAPTGSTSDTTPTFTWTASVDATRYDLWVSNLTTGQSEAIREPNLTTTSYTPTIPLPSGNYRFWVQALNSLGESRGWSPSQTFTVESASAPAIPMPTGPATPTTDNTPTFAWTASPGATRYDLWVANLTTGQAQVIRETSLSTNAFTPTTPLPSGNYRFWVQAFDAGGSSRGWSAHRDFTIRPPAAPNVTGPASPTTNRRPPFAWDASTDATRYDLWVDNVSTGQSQFIRQPNLTATSFTPAADLPVGTYRFWVRALNSLLEGGAWSATRDVVISGGAAPTLTGPTTPTSDNTPTLTWTAGAGAVRFDLWVDNRTTGVSQVIREMNLTATSFTPADALPSGSYRFWVRAFNAAGDAGLWSGPRDFQITPPAAPVLTGPSSAAGSTPTFTWNASPNATRYDLWVDNVSTGQSQLIREPNLTTTSYAVPAPLISGFRYRFWVRAFNSLGEGGSWSSSMEFVVS
jgi:predicted phage tail protein